MIWYYRSISVLILSLIVLSSNSIKLNHQVGRSIALASIDEEFDLISQLESRKQYIYQWVSECDETSTVPGQISNSFNGCVQGDVMLWAGLSCLAAHFANDKEVIDKRCLDVSRGQSANGRWWRGESRIDVQTENSFSRDMALGLTAYMIGEGLLSQDENKKERVKNELKAWWSYIENEQDGKRMCNDAEDNRCKLRGDVPHLIYSVGKTLGAIDSSNKNYKVIQKYKKKSSNLSWNIDFATMTKVDYRIHLKAISLLMSHILGVIDQKNYSKRAQKIYKKDRANSFYELLYTGTTSKLVNEVLDRCPIERPKNSVKHPLRWSATWWPQDNSKERPWEIASGHDCLFMMNLMIAQLKGKLTLPGQDLLKEKETNKCEGKKNYLGVYENLDICKVRPHFQLSRLKCQNENGVIWGQGDKDYCLLGKQTFWKAREIKSYCPKLHSKELNESFADKPVCARQGKMKSISLAKCNNEKLNGVDQVPANFCYINHGEYYEKRSISRICPRLYPQFMNEYVDDSWPVCKRRSKIQENKCVGDYSQKRSDHCLFIEKGWYSYNEFKETCPKGKTYVGIMKDDKPLCKSRISFKIKAKNCSKKYGIKYENYCLWAEDDHWKVRKIK